MRGTNWGSGWRNAMPIGAAGRLLLELRALTLAGRGNSPEKALEPK